jgi:lipopolysaccharide export LptBFGC system permease protein LptF
MIMELNWDNDSIRGLLHYISTADGEGHDAVVYESGFEFDRTDSQSVEQIVLAILDKHNIRTNGAPAINRSLLVPISSFASYSDSADANEKIVQSSRERAERESKARYTYIPDAAEFTGLLSYLESDAYVTQQKAQPLKYNRHSDWKMELAKFFSDPVMVVLAIFIIIAWASMLCKLIGR